MPAIIPAPIDLTPGKIYQARLGRSCRMWSPRRAWRESGSAGWRGRQRISLHNEAANCLPVFTHKNYDFIIAGLPSIKRTSNTIAISVPITACSPVPSFSLQMYLCPVAIPNGCPLYARRHFVIRIYSPKMTNGVFKYCSRGNSRILSPAGRKLDGRKNHLRIRGDFALK